MTPSPAPPSGPSLKQAFGLICAATLLLVSTCFGAFGIGSVLSGPASDAMVPFVLVAALVALAGMFVGVGVVVGRIIRRVASRRVPAGDVASDPAPAPGPVPGRRPTFAQAWLILLAGVVVFLSTCFEVASGGRVRMVPVVPTILLTLGGLAGFAGFAVMIRRVIAAWRAPLRPGGDTSPGGGPSAS